MVIYLRDSASRTRSTVPRLALRPREPSPEPWRADAMAVAAVVTGGVVARRMSAPGELSVSGMSRFCCEVRFDTRCPDPEEPRRGEIFGGRGVDIGGDLGWDWSVYDARSGVINGASSSIIATGGSLGVVRK